MRNLLNIYAQNISFMWERPILEWIFTLILIHLLYGALIYCFYRICRRKSAFIILGTSYFFVVLCYIFQLQYAGIISAIFSSALICICMVANLGDLRMFLATPFKKVTAKAMNFGVEKIFNREEMYKKVEEAVIALSKSRTGAIITFEKNTSLKDIIKNGVPVHAPVSVELLQTIFYEGTRLHDGAVVIHGNEIVAASVFFTPTTKPFAGKYGSRHRAAIGISEVSDAVTIVVSEETGRISIATNGQLESVEQSSFLRVFENCMADDSSEEEN